MKLFGVKKTTINGDEFEESIESINLEDIPLELIHDLLIKQQKEIIKLRETATYECECKMLDISDFKRIALGVDELDYVDFYNYNTVDIINKEGKTAFTIYPQSGEYIGKTRDWSIFKGAN